MKLKYLVASVFAVLILSVAVSGQGIIIPEDCLECPRRPPFPRPHPVPAVLKTKSVKIETGIESQVANTKVEQVFENDTPYTLEGSYFFPIPESAAISDFAIFDGDRRLAAEVVEREKARRIYQEIVRKMIDPGLLEYAGKDLFQARVFPIPPRSTRKIEIAYSQVLRSEGGVVSYRYELGAGRRMARQPIGQIAAQVRITSPVNIKNIFSPSHRIAVTRDGERRAQLSLEGTGEETQRDFQLYYSVSNEDFGLSLITYREPGKDGYFLILVSPSASVGDRERLAKDVIFTFDTSGSMSGEKIEKAKASLRFGIESLSPRDRFNIITFSGEERLFKSGLVEASREARKEAAAFVEGLRAEGGTNINDALVAALRQFDASNRPGMIVFLTDGLPTVGTTDVKQILKNVKETNRAGVRLFSFGVGYDVNTKLLDALSLENKGAADYIEPNEDLEIKVSNFFAKVNYPVLSDLSLDLGGVKADLLYPPQLPDLFKGSQLSIVGRYKNAVNAANLRLTGSIGDKKETFSFGARDFPAEQTAARFLPRIWATRRVGYLLEQIRLNGENRELVDEIVQLGTRFGIVTPYTSFLVTDDQAGPIPLPRPIPSEQRRQLGAMSPGAARDASGEAAVVQSGAVRVMKEFSSGAGLDEWLGTVAHVAGKTFILRQGVWVDTGHDEERRLPQVEVKFGSDEFFKLLERVPDLGEFFSLGEKVVVVFQGKVYRVS